MTKVRQLVRSKPVLQCCLVGFGLLYAAAIVAAVGVKGDWEHRHWTQLPAFDRIYVSGQVDVELSQDNQHQVVARGSAQFVNGLQIECIDNALYIDAPEELSPGVVQVSVQQLKELVSQGGAVVRGDGLSFSDLALEAAGHDQFHFSRIQVADLVVIGREDARITMSGQALHQAIEMADAGHYNAAQLTSLTSAVSVQGAGEVDLHVAQLLDVSVFGNARVSYSGTPWVQRHVVDGGVVGQRL